MAEHIASTGTSAGAGAVAAGKITGGFVHLHLHSEYSLLDGGNRLDKLVARVKELGMNAVAVTDHGNLFGAAAFYLECKEQGVLPILGVEAYVCPPGRARTDRTFTGASDGGYHLVLLAESDEGWQNLLRLCSEAYLTGFYFKPRVDRELLEKHSAGLIAINGHLGSEIGEHLLAYERSGEQKHWERAVESAQWHARTFKGRGPGAEGRGDGEGSGGPGFYVELQHHVDEQIAINKHLIRLAGEMGLPLVCDNDAHFLKAEDHDGHDTLICISMGKVKSDPDRLRYPTELYVKDPREMRELFEKEYGAVGLEACENTVRIAERCAGAVKLPIGANHAPMVRVRKSSALPKRDEARFGGDLSAWYAAYCAAFEVVPFALPDGVSAEEQARIRAEAKAECDEALTLLSEGGFIWRYGRGTGDREERGEGLGARGEGEMPHAERGGTQEGASDHAEKVARLRRELKILGEKNITAYFLIVWDFVNWGRQQGIPALARGSGVGTMVGYVLGLSNACPVRYSLLFERFTDPDRSEYPDIDIDLCQDGRGRVIDYVRRKYGHVAQIITFGTLKARAAVRDVARVLGVSLPAADRLAKLIPEQLNITIDDALEQEPDLKSVYEGQSAGLDKVNKDLGPGQAVDPDTARALIDNARTIEGQARHASVHAAGVIVATRPLYEIVPLYKQSGAADHEIVTQWDGPTCEKVGLLKMDFLGLRTISVIERAKRLIRETLGEEEIWRAVGREGDYQKWRSGGVAEWQSEGQDISRHAGVAAGHGPGAGDLPRDGRDAEGRDVRAHQPDAPGGDIDTDEHRGGVRAAHARGTPARAASSRGLADGTHDGVRDRGLARDDSSKGARARADGGGGSDDQLTHPEAGSQGTRARGAHQARDQEVAGDAASTLPLRHSATSPLPPAHPLDLDRLTYDDPRVFALFQRAETTGVFQFESGGMRRLLTEMRPDRLEDLIAANALFRPGPMDLIPDYNRRKHGQAPVPSVHAIVDHFTRETYGVMVYQEQVMQIVHGLGGIKLRDAYTLIKNISKKKHDKIEKERPKFVDGAQKQGLSKQGAEELFELILKFAGYGFNKSHSTGYAIVAYQTAYLKTYFPNQYMAAFLTYESGAQKVSDWIQYVEDCKKTRFVNGKVGVEVRPPDVNLSGADFTVVFEPGEARTALGGHVRFGLGAIKGVGDKAIEAILRERNGEGAKADGERKSTAFSSLHDFCERVASAAGTGSGGNVLNKTTLEALIKCGAMDSLHGREARAAMLASIEPAMSAAAKAAADKAAGQGGLFMGPGPSVGGKAAGGAGAAKGKPAADLAGGLVKVPAWNEGETLKHEKDALGFYVSSHPLERWKRWAGMFATATCESAKQAGHDQRVVIPGLVQNVRTIICKNGRSAGQKMAIVTVEDATGAIETVLFADPYASFGHLIQPDQCVFMLGRVDRSRAGMAGGGARGGGGGAGGGEEDAAGGRGGGSDGVQVIVDRVVPIDGVPLMPGRLWIRVDGERLNGSGAAAIASVAQAMRAAVPTGEGVNGTMPDRATTFPVDIVIDTAEARVRLEAAANLRVKPTPELAGLLAAALGEGCVRVVGGVSVEMTEDGKRGRDRAKWAKKAG